MLSYALGSVRFNFNSWQLLRFQAISAVQIYSTRRLLGWVLNSTSVYLYRYYTVGTVYPSLIQFQATSFEVHRS